MTSEPAVRPGPARLPAPATRSLEGDGIVVGHEVCRRPPAARCVRGRPAFPAGRGRWLRARDAPAAGLPETVERCPAGALRHHRPGAGRA
ncbi:MULTISPECIES: (4Fe-4S)-binding protein [Streptomyces]|uniref:Divergent 4Fe-4S mono-cluster domain-containing protein n=1 Tax=Streptomyces gougerotii TaxID=53448 RepID=A0A8H9LJZ1_9ACTN|nr:MULTISPECIES: (4Fe-4S)-binding protein [Streptomyces]MBL3804338.1 (4Fe-4S)-binding protein [Streptomyces sp. BRB081]GFH76800.1 hypothetical protein Sgou_14700 [Streptomyces gougerotii]GGU64909.1 hypothetical protein GCM10010227_18020 [Streptomyces gougerotii]